MLSLPRAARRLVAPALLAAALPLLAAAPASADVTGSTSTGDVVLYDHCVAHPIHYQLAIGAGTSLWRVEFQVADPQGHVSQGTVLNSAVGSPTSGTFDYTFCGSETAGTYTVRATGFYEVVPLVQLPISGLTDTTFQVVPAQTRTTAASAKRVGPGRYRVTSRVAEQDEHGYARAEGLLVRVERLVSGHWKRVTPANLTTVHGRATATIAGRPGQRVRVVVPAHNNYTASVSKVVKL